INAGAVKGKDGTLLLESPFFSFLTSGDQGTQVKGKVSEDTAWTKANSPYILAGQVEVTDGAKLTLEPGVEVRGQDNKIVVANGSFISKGSARNRVSIQKARIETGTYSKGSLDIQYTDFTGGLLSKEGSGNLILKDSVLDSRTTLYLSDATSVIERNTFKLNELYMTLGSTYDHIIRNNMFYRGFNAQSTQKIIHYGSEWGSGQTLFEYNSFVGGEGSKEPMIQVSNSSKGLTAKNNYWNTIIEEKIDDKINDGKDQGNEAAILSYTPFLTAPHPSTPKLDALTITDITPEPDGYGVSVNSEVVVSFDRALNPLQLGEWGVSFFTENDGMYLATELRVEGEKLILTIPGGMKPNTKYTVYINAGAVKGKDGTLLLESPFFSFLTSPSLGPATPSVNEITDNTIEVTGTAEPRALVTVKVGYITIGTATADEKGNYTVKILKQKAGTKLGVSATDKVGFTSLPREMIVSDATPPPSPKVNKVTDKSTIISGTAEVNSAITVRVDSKIIGEGTTDESGKFSIAVAKQEAGLKLSVTASDAAGNMSETNEITVSDATAPKKPVVDNVTDKTISITGTAEAGSVILIKADTIEIGQATVTEEGHYAVAIKKQKAGTVLTVTATDKAGNISQTTQVTVADATAPSLPVVEEVNDKSTSVKGTAEANSVVIVKAAGTEIGKATANGDGIFAVTIAKQKAGTKLSITATDAAKNTSSAKSVTVLDATAPTTPTVDQVTDKSTAVTGTGEVNALISIKAGTKELGTAKVAADGKYKAIISVQKAGTKIQVTATDAAGNTSAAKEVTVVDKTSPSVPTVSEVTDKTVTVTGTAEIGSVISVKAEGKELGTGKVAEDGNYKVTIAKQKAGIKIQVTSVDGAGNVSAIKEVIVLDKTAPGTPTVKEVTDKSTTIVGTAESLSQIVVKSGSKEIGTATVDAKGNYSIAILKQKAGTKLILHVKDSAGNVSEEKEITVLDATAPGAPTVDKVTDKSTSVYGSAEAGSTVIVNANGIQLGKKAVDTDGKFTANIVKQKAGTKLNVTAVDAAGNVSEAKEVTVLDVTAPALPAVQKVTDKTTTIKGTAEANSSILIKSEDKQIGKVTVSETGKFELPIEKQKAGTVLKFTATDAAGNVSEVKEIVVQDATAPSVPVVEKVTDKSTVVKGTAEIGSEISIKVGTDEIGSTIVGKEGKYEVVIPKQKAGTLLKVTATDKANNVSGIKEVTVLDETAPLLSTVEKVTDKSTAVKGTAEVGATILVNIAGAEIGKATANSDGNFTVTIAKQKAGTKLNVTATDAAGNVSSVKEMAVLDATAPTAPTVDPVTDKSKAVTGTGEASASISVKVGSKELGTAKVAADGKYKVVIPAQKAGTEIQVTATDAAGNTSAAKEVIVSDKTAPVIPTVNAVTDKSTAITGTAEANSAITVIAGDKLVSEGKADESGSFSLAMEKQQAGVKLSITSTDAAGNVSGAKEITVSDVTAPGKPVIDKVTDKTVSITGKSEAGAVLSIKAGTTEIGNATANEEGHYTVTVKKQQAGTVLKATATDKAGNISQATQTTVLDATAPALPTVTKITDKSTALEGTAEAGSVIVVRAAGVEISKATTDSSGKFAVAIAKQKAGTKLSVTAVDKAGNVSSAKEVTVLDVTAPTAPKVDKVTDKSTVVTGSAEANASISIMNGSKELGTAKVDADGKYKAIIAVQRAGTKIQVTATDVAGNVSAVKEVTVADETAPSAPTVNVVTDQSTVITGTAEAAAQILVKAGKNELATATADAEGNFSASISKQKAGTKLTLTAKDAAGNVSQGKEIIVMDTTAPTVPTVDKVTDKSIAVTGIGELGATISIKSGSTELGKTMVASDGKYKATIAVQKAGTKIQVTATDAAGNASASKEVIVSDATAPEMPIVDEVTDKSTVVKGSAEAGSIIQVTVAGSEIGKSTANSKGNFAVTIVKQKADTKLSVTAKDAAGNISAAREAIVLDATAPVIPSVNGMNDKSTAVTGTAEANSLISVKAGDSELGSTKTDKAGNFSVSIPKQKAGTKLVVSAKDDAGNISEGKEIIVIDATAPELPVIENVTDQSTIVKGSAEANATILIKAGRKELGKVVASDMGKFELSVEKQKAGTVLTITATDAAGNTSDATEVTVTDATPPVVPTVNEVTDKSTAVSGIAEAGSRVSVKVKGKELGTAKADTDGKYNISIDVQKAGTKIQVTSTDVAGNISPVKEVIVLDVTAPTAPTVNNVTEQSTTVTGTAEAASKIAIRVGNNEIGTATVSAAGTYSVAVPKQSVGTVLSIMATDKAGNVSSVKEVVVVDGTSPEISLTNKVTHHSTRIIGSTEADAIITVKAGSKSIGTATANAKGQYEVIITKQKAGTKLSITATDAAGNSSKAITVTVVDGNYPDLKLTHWALDEIMYLADDQIIGGYPNGGFQPEKNTTRAEAAKMLALALDLPIIETSSGYKDVSSKHWAKDYIAAVSKAGLFNGNPDGTFAPNDVLKRAEMAKVISIAYGLNASNKNHFNDVKAGHWAKGYISGLYENGITTGFPDKSFRPGASTTRAEYSVFLARALNKEFR
ncbi:Ig-like domain-containing protein, partial [Planococcus wigleyi]